jgi:hypothetical protein
MSLYSVIRLSVILLNNVLMRYFHVRGITPTVFLLGIMCRLQLRVILMTVILQIILSAILMNVIAHVEHSSSDCHFDDYCSLKRHYAECYSFKCHSSECHCIIIKMPGVR